MAVIVAFPTRPAPIAPAEPDRSRMAQILFFTGVRYERQAETVQAGPASRGGPISPAPRGGQTPQRRRRRG